MKKGLRKRIGGALLAGVMAIGMLAGCGSADGGNENTSSEAEDKGTIMWLSSLTAGESYERSVAYAENFLGELGYDFKVVYADMTNDPNANLNAVRNAMTKDVVGLVTTVDGGIVNIMDEYPDLYVAGYNSDLRAVYEEGGAAESLQQNEKYLGTISDVHYDGTITGQEMFDVVVEKGYKKVATTAFPGYAYPNLQVAETTFRSLVEEYNKTAEDKIEIVGEQKLLQFEPLEESWFLEEGNDDLDAIVCFCSGIEFVYPTLKSAVANGVASPDTKLVTGGFTFEEDLISDVGGDGTIQYLYFAATENFGYSLELLVRAAEGRLYDDFTPTRMDSRLLVMNTAEDVETVLKDSFSGSGDLSKLQVSNDEINGAESFEDLKAIFESDKLTIDGIKK